MTFSLKPWYLKLNENKPYIYVRYTYYECVVDMGADGKAKPYYIDKS